MSQGIHLASQDMANAGECSTPVNYRLNAGELGCEEIAVCSLTQSCEKSYEDKCDEWPSILEQDIERLSKTTLPDASIEIMKQLQKQLPHQERTCGWCQSLELKSQAQVPSMRLAQEFIMRLLGEISK